jgi:hypothetical protein
VRQLAAAFKQASLLAVPHSCTDSKLAPTQSGSKLPHSKSPAIVVLIGYVVQLTFDFTARPVGKSGGLVH